MKTNVTSLLHSNKLKEIGLDQNQGFTMYNAVTVTKLEGIGSDTSLPDVSPSEVPMCAAYTLEQLMYIASQSVGNFGFPAQVRSHMIRKARTAGPERVLQHLYSYKDISFVIDGENPIEVLANLILVLHKSYHVSIDAMNKRLAEFNAS